MMPQYRLDYAPSSAMRAHSSPANGHRASKSFARRCSPVQSAHTERIIGKSAINENNERQRVGVSTIPASALEQTRHRAVVHCRSGTDNRRHCGRHCVGRPTWHYRVGNITHSSTQSSSQSTDKADGGHSSNGSGTDNANGTGGEAGTDGADGDNQDTVTDNPLKIVESGWSADQQGYVHYAFALRNTSKTQQVQYPQITIRGGPKTVPSCSRRRKH